MKRLDYYCGILILAAAVVLSGRVMHPVNAQPTQTAVPAVIKAREFQLVDSAGHVRAVLQVQNGSQGTCPSLIFYNSKMRAGASLLQLDDVALLSLPAMDEDPNIKNQSGLFLVGNHEPGMLLTSDKGHCFLQSARSSGGALKLLDQNGKASFAAPQ